MIANNPFNFKAKIRWWKTTQPKDCLLRLMFRWKVAFTRFRFLLFVPEKNSDGWRVGIVVLTAPYIPNKENQKTCSNGKTYSEQNDNNVHGYY